jgi:polyisoprenoid-binding protein YceI
MTRIRASLQSLSILLLLTVPALTQAQSQSAPVDFNLDTATTAIHWTLSANVHTVHGTFKLKSGAFRIDPATGDASGLIVIDATSGDSGDGARDKRMNNVVLESARYPTITFRPTHVNGKVDLSAPGPITVNGIMTIHGQDHPLQLSVSLRPKDSTIASETHFDVPYVAWGMKDPSLMMFRVDKQVHIDLDAAAVPAASVALSR